MELSVALQMILKWNKKNNALASQNSVFQEELCKPCIPCFVSKKHATLFGLCGSQKILLINVIHVNRVRSIYTRHILSQATDVKVLVETVFAVQVTCLGWRWEIFVKPVSCLMCLSARVCVYAKSDVITILSATCIVSARFCYTWPFSWLFFLFFFFSSSDPLHGFYGRLYFLFYFFVKGIVHPKMKITS